MPAACYNQCLYVRRPEGGCRRFNFSSVQQPRSSKKLISIGLVHRGATACSFFATRRHPFVACLCDLRPGAESSAKTALRLRYLRRSEVRAEILPVTFQIPPHPLNKNAGFRHILDCGIWKMKVESLLPLGHRQQRHLSRWPPLVRHDLITKGTLQILLENPAVARKGARGLR